MIWCISLAVLETDFIKYSGTFGDNVQGSVDASLVRANLNVEGKDSSKLQSSFGSLKKEGVDVQKLLQNVKDRSAPLTQPTDLHVPIKEL